MAHPSRRDDGRPNSYQAVIVAALEEVAVGRLDAALAGNRLFFIRDGRGAQFHLFDLCQERSSDALRWAAGKHRHG